jgi:hypothetical protein
MFKTQSLVLIFLFFSVINFAQSIKMEGIVQDTLRKPLEMANVMAINQDTKAMDAYGITNDKGKFQLNLKPNSNYKIKVSFIGFQSLDLSVQTQTENFQKVITLKEGGISLEHALLEASFKGRLEIVKYLVEKGANIHANNDYSLRYARLNGHIEVVNYLQNVMLREKLCELN